MHTIYGHTLMKLMCSRYVGLHVVIWKISQTLHWHEKKSVLLANKQLMVWWFNPSCLQRLRFTSINMQRLVSKNDKDWFLWKYGNKFLPIVRLWQMLINCITIACWINFIDRKKNPNWNTLKGKVWNLVTKIFKNRAQMLSLHSQIR